MAVLINLVYGCCLVMHSANHWITDSRHKRISHKCLLT